MIEQNIGAFGWNIEKVIKKGDYLYASVKEHPKATINGYVLLHRIIMENHIGRLLSDDEIVHHIDGNKKNNNIDNLLLMDKKKHVSLHVLERGEKWVDLKCPQCGVVFSRREGQTHLHKGSKCTCCSRECRGKFYSYIQFHGVTAKVEKAISENIVCKYRKYLHDNSEETAITDSVETIRLPPEMVKI